MYNCQFCHSSYVWPHDLTRHIRRKHDPYQKGMHSQHQLEVYSQQQQSRRHHVYPSPQPKLPQPPPPQPQPPPPPPPQSQETYFRTGRKPVKLRVDEGTEYRNRDVQRLLKRDKVDHFFTQNEQKSSYAERAIKTIKPLHVPSSDVSLDRRPGFRVTTEVIIALSRWHPERDQKRRSPIVEGTVWPSGDLEEHEPAFRLQERRHRVDLARETTFRSRVRQALNRGILRGG